MAIGIWIKEEMMVVAAVKTGTTTEMTTTPALAGATTGVVITTSTLVTTILLLTKFEPQAQKLVRFLTLIEICTAHMDLISRFELLELMSLNPTQKKSQGMMFPSRLQQREDQQN